MKNDRTEQLLAEPSYVDELSAELKRTTSAEVRFDHGSRRPIRPMHPTIVKFRSVWSFRVQTMTLCRFLQPVENTVRPLPRVAAARLSRGSVAMWPS